jgi:hypothetical protein
VDDNTFKLALAIVGSIQVMVLAWLAVQQTRTTAKVATVHNLVNGLSHEKDAAISIAAGLQGELAGRDFEAAKHPPGEPPPLPPPVRLWQPPAKDPPA